MAVNDKIDKDDYNSIVTVINNVLGSGSGNSGYGQSVQSSNVSVSNRITVNEWNDLANDLRSIGIHQNGTTPSLPTANEGNIVKFNSTTEPYDRYLTVANNFASTRFNLGAGQFITVNKNSQSRTFSWKNQVECTITIDFGTANDARHFFNSGGQIRINSTRTGGTTSGGASTIATLKIFIDAQTHSKHTTQKQTVRRMVLMTGFYKQGLLALLPITTAPRQY